MPHNRLLYFANYIIIDYGGRNGQPKWADEMGGQKMGVRIIPDEV